MRVLIVEDQPDIAANVGDYLGLKGHTVDYASDGAMGLNLACQHTFDAIVLDVNLPKLNGFELCRILKQERQVYTPILMLTARDSLHDKVTGFELGALDYLVKPFELRELELRLLALQASREASELSSMSFEDIELFPQQQRALRAGRELSLHTASFKILEILIRAAPKVVTRQELEYQLWGEHIPSSDPLRSHMYELRQALDKGLDDKLLKTIRGVGYALRASSPESLKPRET